MSDLGLVIVGCATLASVVGIIIGVIALAISHKGVNKG